MLAVDPQGVLKSQKYAGGGSRCVNQRDWEHELKKQNGDEGRREAAGGQASDKYEAGSLCHSMASSWAIGGTGTGVWQAASGSWGIGIGRGPLTGVQLHNKTNMHGAVAGEDEGRPGGPVMCRAVRVLRASERMRTCTYSYVVEGQSACVDLLHVDSLRSLC